MSITPPQLMRRLLNQIQKGKGIRFSAQEVDLLVTMGLVEIVSTSANRYTCNLAAERHAALLAKEAKIQDPPLRAIRSDRQTISPGEASAQRVRA